ncbi:MAG: 2-C-methyl-D-erythritol 4-phosphate cytidylyltransferase [Lachnospiraceae bacterium]|nr:2-C-methyl-D-erythritol 4-phosphate cytidylyltransferase [Lachnospiraceae bacterium]
MNGKDKTAAILLAAGSGKRMGGPVKKQFMPILGKPMIYYSLKAFEESFIDEVILVCSPDDEGFIRSDIIERYGFTKVKKIVPGGRERYDSVLSGLNSTDDADYVFIHDGARPMIDNAILERGLSAVRKYDACVIGMPSKDTVKIADEEGIVSGTPNRNLVWNVQTPQIFSLPLIKEAYNDVVSRADEYKDQGITITDDAMILELYNGHNIRLVEGSYRNIKVTTQEDIILAEAFLKFS